MSKVLEAGSWWMGLEASRREDKLLNDHSQGHGTQEAELRYLLSLIWDILHLRGLWAVHGEIEQ